MRLHRVMTLGLAGLMAATVGTTVVQAEPGGCLKYGAAGAVGGHLANHAVLGATAGCVTGMYRRHEYRKEARNKAKLYDQEHPGAKGTYEQKATAYDVEHSTLRVAQWLLPMPSRSSQQARRGKNTCNRA